MLVLNFCHHTKNIHLVNIYAFIPNHIAAYPNCAFLYTVYVNCITMQFHLTYNFIIYIISKNSFISNYIFINYKFSHKQENKNRKQKR